MRPAWSDPTAGECAEAAYEDRARPRSAWTLDRPKPDPQRIADATAQTTGRTRSFSTTSARACGQWFMQKSDWISVSGLLAARRTPSESPSVSSPHGKPRVAGQVNKMIFPSPLGACASFARALRRPFGLAPGRHHSSCLTLRLRFNLPQPGVSNYPCRTPLRTMRGLYPILLADRCHSVCTSG